MALVHPQANPAISPLLRAVIGFGPAAGVSFVIAAAGWNLFTGSLVPALGLVIALAVGLTVNAWWPRGLKK